MSTSTTERLGLDALLQLHRLSDLPGIGRSPPLPAAGATDAEWKQHHLRWGERMDRLGALTGWPCEALMRIEMLEDQLEREVACSDRLMAGR